MLANAHKQGIVTEVSNLVHEYLQGNYNRSKDDLALLAVPQFKDDHWVQDSEEKCNLLLNVQKVKPLLEQTEEAESDVSTKGLWADSQTSTSTRKRAAKKGVLFAKMYESLKVGSSLFFSTTIGLQRPAVGGEAAAPVPLVRSVHRRRGALPAPRKSALSREASL